MSDPDFQAYARATLSRWFELENDTLVQIAGIAGFGILLFMMGFAR